MSSSPPPPSQHLIALLLELRRSERWVPTESLDVHATASDYAFEQALVSAVVSRGKRERDESLDALYDRLEARQPGAVGELQESRQALDAWLAVSTRSSTTDGGTGRSVMDINSSRQPPLAIGLLRDEVRRLTLSTPEVQFVPVAIGRLSALRELTLNGVNIDRLPSALGDLRALERLRVIRTPITEFPASLGRLVRLTYFESNENLLLLALPNEMIGARALQLIGIVQSPQLTRLPEMVQFFRLQRLTLRATGVRRLPDNTNLVNSLLQLDLMDARLDALPTEFANSLSRLERFDATSLVAPNLTDFLALATNLRHLTLEYASPLDVERVQSALAAMQRLERLDVSSTDMTMLPPETTRLTLRAERPLTIVARETRLLGPADGTAPSLPSELAARIELAWRTYVESELRVWFERYGRTVDSDGEYRVYTEASDDIDRLVDEADVYARINSAPTLFEDANDAINAVIAESIDAFDERDTLELTDELRDDDVRIDELVEKLSKPLPRVERVRVLYGSELAEEYREALERLENCDQVQVDVRYRQVYGRQVVNVELIRRYVGYAYELLQLLGCDDA